MKDRDNEGVDVVMFAAGSLFSGKPDLLTNIISELNHRLQLGQRP